MTMLTFLTPSTLIQTVNAASLHDSLVMNLTERHTESNIDINLNMITNTGVSAMTLELVYNRNIFQFEGHEKGAALNGLDFIATDLSEDETLPIKFNWFSNDLKNNFTKGIILKLHFSLKPNIPAGQYEIGFRYNNGDIICIENSSNFSKSAIIGKAVIDIEEEKIAGTEIVSDNQEENTYLIVGIVASVVAISAISTLYILKTIKKKRKRRREKWSEI